MAGQPQQVLVGVAVAGGQGVGQQRPHVFPGQAAALGVGQREQQVHRLRGPGRPGAGPGRGAWPGPAALGRLARQAGSAGSGMAGWAAWVAARIRATKNECPAASAIAAVTSSSSAGGHEANGVPAAGVPGTGVLPARVRRMTSARAAGSA